MLMYVLEDILGGRRGGGWVQFEQSIGLET